MKLTRIQSFILGLKLPFDGLKLTLQRPRLFIWAIIPILITFSFYGFFVNYTGHRIQLWMDQLLNQWGISSHSWLVWLFRLTEYGVLLGISALTFSFAGNIVACPFNDFLAEQAEAYVHPPLPPPPHRDLVGKVKIIALDVLKSLLAILGSWIFILLSWIPVFGVVALGALFLLFTFQFISYPQTRRGQGLGWSFYFLWKYFYVCFGFGTMTSVLFSIPILSCFAVPLVVVGGTLLVARAQEHPGQPQLQ